MPIFEYNGKKYNVKDEHIESFTNDYPEASTIMEREGKKYRVKSADYKTFLSEYTPQNTERATNDEKPTAAPTVPEVEEPTGPTGETPLTEEDKMRMGASIAQMKRRTQQTMDNLSESMKTMREYTEKASLSGGQTAEGSMRFNQESGKFEKTYITPYGNRYSNKSVADKESFMYRQAADMSLNGQLRKANSRLREINERLEARGKELLEDKEQNQTKGVAGFIKEFGKTVAADKMGGNDGQTAEDSFEFQNDSEYQSLRLAKRELEDQIQQLENYSEKERKGERFLSDFGRNTWQAISDGDAWDFGKNQLRDAATKLSIANKANSGEELSESEQEALYEQFMHDNVMSEFGDLGKGAHWGDIAGGSLSFMKDFLITGGFGGISTKLTTQIGTNIAAKAATKLSINAAESLGMRIAKDGLFATIRQGGRGVASRLLAEQGIKGSTQLLATRVLGVTAEDLLIRAPLMVTTVQGQSTAAEIINTKLGPVIVDQDTGELRFKDDKSWGEASWQTGADKVIENFSEMWGAHIPGMSDVTKVFGARNLTAALLRSTRPGAGTILSKTSEFLGKLGINGYFGEVGEEYYGQLWRTMLNLDSSKDSEGNNQFRSSDFHEDIWGGMAMSIGLTGGTTMAVNYAGKATDKTLKGAKYIHLKHELNKASAKASEVMTPEVWSELRQIIDHSDNDDMCVLARETMNDADITDEQRSAVMDYMERSMIMRGYNLGEYVRRKNGEEPNALEEELDQCYIDGYNIETSQEMNDTKNLYDYQRQRVLDIIEEDFLADIDDDPARHLEYIRDAEEWNDEERGILLDYLNAKQVYDGMIQRVRDDIDGQVERSNSIIDSRTNHTTGMLQAATMKVDNRRVYIINGNVAQNSEGGITDYSSSGSVIVRDAETGVLEQIAPESLLSIEESLDPNIEKQTSADAIRQQYAQEAANKIDGVVTFNPGDTYTIAGDDAQIQVQVVANDEGIVDNGDGTVNVSDGVNIFPIAKETIEQQTEAAQLARVAEFEQQRALENASSKLAEKRPQYTYNDKVTLRDSEGNIIHGEIAEHNEADDSFVVDVDYPIGGKYVPQLSRAELERMIIEHNGVAVKPINAENSNNSDDSSNIGNNAPQNIPVNGNNAPQNIPVNGNNAPQKVISPSVDELKVPGDTQVAEQQPSAFERVPKDEHGTPLYEKTDSDTAWDAIVEQTEGDESMAQTVADGMVADKEAALKKLEKAKSKGGATVAEKIAAEKERKAAIDAAQQELNIWKKIAGTANRRRMDAEAERRRVADEAAALRKAEEERLRAEREEAERIEREALNGVPDMVDDTPQDARARGYRRVSGHKIDRQEPLQAVQGKEVAVRFSDDAIANGRVAVIDAAQLQPSHIQGVRNPLHFIDEAQPKERNDEASVMSARKIAGNIRPEEITSSVTAYTGAPTVNARGESIQGNNRSDALRLMWESHKEQASKYKQYLIDHAEEFGLNANDVAAMERPVLVNMLDVDDAEAITLGQFVAQDTESGGTERIKPKNALQKMGNDMRSFANLLLKSNDEDTSFAGLVDNNGVEVLKWMSQRGYITPTQYSSAFDSKGNLTAEAKNDLRGIMYQSIFKGGSTRLEEMFNTMPAKAQKAILATAFRDYDSPNAERMIEEIQNSIRAYYALSTDNAFVSAKNYKEARIAVEGWKNQYQIDDANGESILPAEKFSNFALLLAAMYKGEKQSVIQGTFNKLFDLIQGIQEPNLFEQPDNTPRTLAQAINETLNIIYNGQRRSNVLASDSSASQRGQQGSTGDAATGERIESGERTADSAGSIEAESTTGGEAVHQPQPERKGLEQTSDGGRETDGTGVADDATQEVLGASNRGDIRVLEEGLDTSYREYSEYSERTRRTTESERLVSLAKQHGLFIPAEVTKTLTGKYPKRTGESVVYIDTVAGKVTKVKDPYAKSAMKSGVQPEDAAFEHLVHNLLFPETAYTLEGISEEMGDVRIVLSQDFIQNYEQPTKEQIAEALAARGLFPEDNYSFGNELVSVTDVEGDNVLLGEDGTVYFIDPIIRFKKPLREILAALGGAEQKAPTIGEQVQAAEAEVNTNPTEAQKEAGNYKKGHVQIGTFNITIEQPKGSVRSGVDADGKKWEIEMQNTYGYIRGTEGVDGDHIDVFLSDDIDGWDGHKVFVVDQRNADGSFDEHKVMLGFNDINDAEAAYMSNYEEGWQGLGAITGVSIEEFEKWIASSHRKTKAFAEYKSVKTTEGQSASAERRNLADFKEGDVVRDYYDKKLYRIKKHSKNGVSTIAELDAEGNEVGTTTMNAHNNSRYSLAEAPVKAETPTISQKSEQVSDQDNAPYTIAPAQYTTKKGKVLDMHLVKFAGELTKEQQRAAKELAKAEKGWYDREQGGFMMRSEESAKQLADTILNNDDAVSDAQPVSLEDTRKVTYAQQPNVENSKSSGNRLVSDERYAELRERMRKKLGGQLNIGIDPEILAIGTEMAVYHLETGARKFAEYAKAMIEDLGDAIRPYLKAFYNGARNLPEVESSEIADDMTPYEDVQQFNVASFDKEYIDPFTTAEIIVAEQAHQEEAEQSKQEIINNRNTERRKDDEQTSANTEAIASQAEAVADEAERIIDEATTEEEITEVEQKIDEQLNAIDDQLSKFNIDSLHSGMRVILKDGRNMLLSMVMHWGEQISATQMSKPQVHRLYALYKGQLIDIAPEDVDIDATRSLLENDKAAVPIKNEQKQSKTKNSTKKAVNLQQSGELGLFDSLFDNETSKEDGLQRNDATRSEGVSANGNRHEQGLSRGSETGSESEQQGSRGTDNGRETTGDAVDRTVRPRLSDTVTEPKNTRNNHSERGKDHAPTSVDARIEANIKAIELAKQLLESGEAASEKQMQTLRKFSGWGGLGKAFSEGTSYTPNNISKRLRELLGEAAYQEAVMSANSAYYTPAYVVDTLWDIAEQMGFKGGNILEGSAGIGNILGQMPTHISERSDIHAIEIDGTSGGILSLLYPDAKVEIQGFEETRIANGSVDLAITNVPFVTGLRVNDTTGDKDLSKKFHNIHDFCIAKNVRKLREGGLGIFITSNGTLDNSKKLRDWIVGEGSSDFVGAFRMHNKTFGGTGVTSDIIVIRKRVNGKKSKQAIDVSTITGARVAEYDTGETRKVKGKPIPVIKQLSMDYNRYFIEHPENMAGEMHFAFEKGDTFRPTSMGLYPKGDKKQEQMLAEFVQSFTAEEFGEQATDEIEVIDAMPGKKIGEMFVSDGKLYINAIGAAQPLEVNANKVKGHTKVECFEAYSAIKEALGEVLMYQTENESDDGLQALLNNLNNAYDDFVATYGHFNKNTAIAFLRNDVDYANVFALEKYEETGDAQGNKVQHFGKTDVFSRRVVEKEKEPAPTNVKDGIVASIFKFGRVDIPYIAEQLGKSEAEVKAEIIESGYGFEDPATRQIEVSYLYLSGNVREKLRQAQENNENGVYDRNIKALQEVMPMDIPAHLIDFTLGSSWIEPKLYEEYVKERTEVGVQFTAVGGTWFMNEPYFTNYEKNRAMGVTSEMLGHTVMGHTLIEAAIQNRSITVSTTKKNWDGSTETITDKEATQACSAKIDEIRQDFKEWARQKMQSDAEMSERMERVYNDTFNNYVPMSIPDEFVPEYFGGTSHKFKMRPHQGRAIVRGTMQPLLLAHEVGTGKTFTLISTAMEMRRLGTARKPMIVVQNATVGQFVASAKELYPNAKILTLEEADRSAEGRKNFYAKIRYNDWDMIVVPQSTFEFIPDSEERQMAFVQDKIEEKMLVLEQMKEADPNGSSMITRQAEREVAALEEQLAELSDAASKKRSASDEKKRAVALQNAEVKAMEMLDRRTDDVENFDDMGIDALLIDEAHEYKHLGFATAMQRGVKGVDPSYSKKSQGVYLKTQAVLEKNNGRNVIFATGTPISNTAAEIWTFMRYLMPADTMKEYGIYYFDDFVRNFGNIQQMLEFSTSGKFKENNRFVGYVNLPELVRIWSGVADTVLTKEAGGVKDKIPEMEKGKAQDLYLPQTRALRSIMKYVKSELEHYDQMSGKEKKENSHIPLTMYGIAKAAAVDARLVQSDAEDDVNSKTNEAVRQTLRSLQETSSYKGTVAIFADNYQNKESGFNLYDDIRTKLIAEGVSADEIVVMKSGMTVKKKLEIFEKVNRGEVRVILGSTFTLGTGVNIQERLHTLIHLDAPNRPMDYTQRNGRILRQGNLHKDMDKPVRILRFGVEDSLDVTAYQRLKTKGAIADSIMNGKQMMTNSMTNRVLEEEEDVFGDTVAQLSGSEYAMLKNNAEKNVRKYASRRKQWEADQTYIHNAKPRLKAFIKDAEQRIEDNSRYLEAVRSSFPDGKFKEIVIGKHRYSSIEAMQEYFKDHNKSILAEMKQMKDGEVSGEQKRELSIKIGDFTYVVTTKLTRQTVRDGATLFNDVERKMHYSCPALGIEDIPVRQNLLRNAIEDIVNNVITGKDFSERLESAEHSKKHNEAELEQLLSREGKAFEYEAELEQAKSQYEEYSELMKKELEEKEAKYAELDSSVELADDLTKTDEDDEILYRTDDEQMEFEKKLRSIKSKYGLRGGGQSIAIYDEGDLERVRMILDKDVYEKIESKFYKPNILGCSLPQMGYAFIFTSKTPDAESTWWHENAHIIYESLELADKEDCGLAALNWLKKQGISGEEHYNYATSKYERSSWGEEGATRLVQYLIETYGAEEFLNSNFDGNEKISKLANAIRNKFIYGKEEPTEYDILQRRRIAEIYGISQANGGMDRGGRESSRREGDIFLRSGRYGESGGIQRNAETQYGSSEEEDAREIRNREGAGAYSDDELSYENDPISKVLGRNRFAKKQRKEFAERTRQRMVERVESLAKKLHLDNVDIVESENGLKELKGNKSKAKGFYSKNTGKITIVIPNHASVFDVEQTLLHEAVAHYGLRKLFGEHFDTFLDNVFNNANIAIREQIVALASKNGWDFRKATEEYLATLAEDINFEEANKSGWWQRIKDYFLEMLHKIGFEGFSGITLTNNELRYILWRSYENLAEPGRYRNILGEAADVAKQYELKVGNYAENLAVNAEVAESNSDESFENPTIEDDDLFRDGSVEPEMHERTLARDRYESRVRNGMFQTQEALQDSMLGLKEAMLSIVGNGTNIEDIDGYENAYLGENRLSSVNKAEADAFAHTIFKPMLEEVAKLARNEAERNEIIDYMMAKHGLERNTYMRSEAIKNGTDVDKALNTDYAGLTALTGQYEVADAEAEAEAMVYVYEHSHETAKLWEKVNSVSKSILQKSYECGMMSKETFEKISEMYEFYIPLRGFDEKTSAEAYAYLTHKHSAFNAPIKKAEGRRSKADDPFANLQSMAESAIIQGNRNKLVKQRFLNFALNHPSDLVSVSEIWVEYDAISDEWKPVFPDNIDSSDSAEEVERKMLEFDSKMHELEEEYPDRYKHGKDAIGIPYRIVESRDMRQHQVVVKRSGRDYVITINGNPRAAQALNGQTNPDNDMSGAIGAILHAGEKVNRQLSAFYTTRNPDFIVSNFMRDMLYTNSMAWVKERPSYALRFHRNYLMVNPVTMKRLLAKHRNGKLDMSNKTEYLFHQFMINGGETGYTNIRDIEQHKNDIKRELKRSNGRLKIGRAMSLLAEKLDEINRAVENCARFAAFVTSREMGRSIDRAIYDAKEISVNFNKKGSGAKFYNSVGQTTSGNASAFVSGLGRSGYVFWNAAIQGTTNFGRQLKRRPIKALTGAAVMFLLGAIVAYMGGDDNDDDKNAYYNLPEYVRRSNIMFRTGDSWISIPLPIEYRAFYGMGELMMSVLSQKEHFTGGEIAEAVLGQATQIMPIDFLEGSGGLNAFVPSSMKPMWEAYVSEKSWTGLPLYKDSPFNKDMPEWTKAYKSANKHLVNLSATLNAASGGDAYTKGSIDINPAKVEYMLNGYFGGVSGTIDKMTKMYETWFGDREYDPRSILIWNRLVKAGDERTEYRAVNNEYFRIEKEITNTKRRLKAYENDTDKGIFDYAEKIDFLYNSPEYARYEIFEYYRRDIENLYKELQEAEDYGDKEWVRQVESDLNMRKKEMIQEMNTTRNRK